MKNKILLKIWLLGVLVFTLLITSLNFVIDPFQQYRVKTFYPIHYSNTRYKNAGFSKNFTYNSLILGTSMAQNFVLSKTEQEMSFKKLIKLCISGGTAREQSIVLKTAINHNSNIKNVLWGLDVFSFSGDPKRLRYGKESMPMHLYDNNILNDYKYLLSFDTLQKSFQAIIYPFIKDKNDIRFNYNLMDQWQHLHENDFKTENVIEHYLKDKVNKNLSDINSFIEFKNSFDFNFYQIIKSNKEIKFTIFFPPYSILSFINLENKSIIDDVFLFKKYIYNKIGHLKNVEIYDFQIEQSITHNLTNYKDLTHYHQKINNWMLKQMSEGKYLVSSKNVDSNNYILGKQIKQYNIEKIINEKNINTTK